MEMSILIFTMGHHYLLLSWSSVLYGYKFFPNENLTVGYLMFPFFSLCALFHSYPQSQNPEADQHKLFLSSLSFVVLLLTNLNVCHL